MNLPAMKAIFLTLLPAAVSFALTPPYLISALPKSDSSIVLQWRNNDIEATGFIVLRKEAGAAAFVPTDSVKNASQNSYTDQPLKDSTAYVYRLRAYNASSVSDTSNSLQATTYKKTVVQVFEPPVIGYDWNYYTASKSVALTIWDRSNCEEGFIIYRAEYRDGFWGGYTTAGRLTSANPLEKLPVPWNDDSVSINQSYKYKVCAYKSKDSVYSNEIAIYTGKAPPLHHLVKFSKKSEFPINFPGFEWSAKAGDSIIFKENPSPARSYSVINIKDISKPLFAGYIDSVKLLDYPVTSLIPVFMKYNVVNNTHLGTSVLSWGNRIVMVKNSVLTLYEVQGSDLILRDSLKSFFGNLIPAFEDSMVLASGGSDVLPVRLNGSKLTAMDTICFDDFVKYMFPRGYDFHCFTNNKIYFTAYESVAPGQIYSHTYLLDLNCKPPAKLHLKFAFPPLDNTGLYLSSFMNICTVLNSPKETRLLAIDLRNPQSWQIAEKSKAIYRDTVNPSQNLRNIILDSLSKNLFLFYTNKLVILGYEYDSTYNGTKLSGSPQARHRGGLTVYRDFFRGKSAVLFFPSVAGAAVSVFDLRGRLVRQMERVYSAERIDVPEAQAGAVYVVGVVVEGRRYAARVMFGR